MTYQKNKEMDYIFSDETSLAVFDSESGDTHFFDETGIDICPGLPDVIPSARFRLAIPGSILVEAEMRDGELLSVTAVRRETGEAVAIPVRFRGAPWGVTGEIPAR